MSAAFLKFAVSKSARIAAQMVQFRAQQLLFHGPPQRGQVLHRKPTEKLDF